MWLGLHVFAQPFVPRIKKTSLQCHLTSLLNISKFCIACNDWEISALDGLKTLNIKKIQWPFKQRNHSNNFNSISNGLFGPHKFTFVNIEVRTNNSNTVSYDKGSCHFCRNCLSPYFDVWYSDHFRFSRVDCLKDSQILSFSVNFFNLYCFFLKNC